jgi:hypothetical protein
VSIDSDLRCGFRRHYSGGTAPDFHRTSLTLRASKYRSGSYIEKNALSSLIFSLLFFLLLYFFFLAYLFPMGEDKAHCDEQKNGNNRR